MLGNDFFKEIEHTAVPWRQYELHVPIFYPDINFMMISMVAPLEKIKTLLPSPRMKPYRISPWHSLLTITGYQYKECDLGPYNEVSVGVPITLDKETPLFTGSLRKLPKSLVTYVRHLPVTTQIAYEVGAEFAGYPKFVAGIDFSEDNDWLTCELKDDDKMILKLSGRKLGLKQVPRVRVSPITHRNGYLLRSELVISEREMGTSKDGNDVKLELGDHPIAQEIREINPGNVVNYSYCPHAKGILTPVFESYAC